MPLPPIEEQKHIAHLVEQRVFALEALKEESRCASALLRERRAALISAAVTGKIDVRDHVNIEQAAA